MQQVPLGTLQGHFTLSMGEELAGILPSPGGRGALHSPSVNSAIVIRRRWMNDLGNLVQPAARVDAAIPVTSGTGDSPHGPLS